MGRGSVIPVVCILLVIGLVETVSNRLSKEAEKQFHNINNALRVIQSNSHLPKIAASEGIPHFDTETFTSLGHQDTPCKEPQQEKYRRSDGVCNNLRNPFRGASMDTERRIFKNYYLDGRGFPRVLGKDSQNLPSAREISLKCFGLEEDDTSPGSKIASQVVWQFGQLLAHDMTLVERFKDGTTCCDNFTRDAPYDALYRGDKLCFPIELPEDEPYFNATCMGFSRAFAVEIFGLREQVNGITAYIDASTVYGPSETRTNQLRLGVQGDARVSDHPGLIAMHSMFHVDHNRIVRRLFALNRHWDDEKLFQEARKILTAIFQKIIWEDYIPLLVGKDAMKAFHLTDPYVYDDSIDAAAILEFTATALRFGHSMINTRLENVEIAKLYFRPIPPEKVVSIPFFMAHNKALILDKDFSTQVRERMYEHVHLKGFDASPLPSFDLPSLNIQRGRDFGLAPYHVVRDVCLQLLDEVQGARNETPACLKAGVYKYEEDIDLFVGGMAETHLPGAIMGPTFACLTAIQFHRLRFGDRFFYEKTGPEGFTPEQIKFIKQNSIAAIICELDPDGFMQRDAFQIISESNPLVPCPTILSERNLQEGLSLWKETHRPDSVTTLLDL